MQPSRYCFAVFRPVVALEECDEERFGFDGDEGIDSVLFRHLKQRSPSGRVFKAQLHISIIHSKTPNLAAEGYVHNSC